MWIKLTGKTTSSSFDVYVETNKIRAMSPASSGWHNAIIQLSGGDVNTADASIQWPDGNTLHVDETVAQIFQKMGLITPT